MNNFIFSILRKLLYPNNITYANAFPKNIYTIDEYLEENKGNIIQTKKIIFLSIICLKQIIQNSSRVNYDL